MWLIGLIACGGCSRTEVESTCDDVQTPPDPCAGLDCIDVCGLPFAKGAPPALVGWTVVDLPAPEARDVVRIGAAAYAVDGTSVRAYGDDLAPLGVLGPLDVPFAIAPAGDGVVVQLADGAFVVVSGADPAAPTAIAAWHPLTRDADGESTGAQLFGGWRGRALVGSYDPRSALAVVDFSDPNAPVVEACLSDPDAPIVYDVRATDDVVALGVMGFEGEPDTAKVALFDPAGAETPYAHLATQTEGVFALDGSRLAVWQDDGIGLYDVSSGAPVEVGRRRQGGHFGSVWHPVVAGGVVLHGGGGDDGYVWGLDLRDDALPLVHLDPGIGDGVACPLAVSSEAGVQLFDVVPAWSPNDRFAPGTAPACPGGGSEPFALQAGGVSPDGAAVLVKDDQGPWQVFTPADGTLSPTVLPDDAYGAWWLDGAFVYLQYWGYNQTELHVLAEDGSTDVTRQLPGPHDWIAADGDRVWIVGEPAPWNEEDEAFRPPDPSTRLAWTLTMEGSLTPFLLPAGSKPRALLPAGDGVALVDEDGHHHLLSRDGDVVAELPGKPIYDAIGFAASADAVFAGDVGGRIWQSRAGERPVELAPACSGVRITGAEAGLVRWNRTVQPAPWFAGYEITELVDPATGAVVASLPAPTSVRVQGRPGALVGRGIFVVDDAQ